MRTQAWTSASIKSHRLALKHLIDEFILIKESVLREAHSRGLGFRTEAALAAALKITPQLESRTFERAEFIARIEELTDGTTADVVSEIFEGAKLNVLVTKRSAQRQASHRYSDVAYDVSVKLEGLSSEILNDDILFHLPEFGRNAHFEPYRVDSAFDHRAKADYSKTRLGDGKATLLAKLVDGCWHGAFYVYAPEHQVDDAQCVNSLKIALIRAILPQLPTRVRCLIFRPDNYQFGAWRVELRVPRKVQRGFGRSNFDIDIPSLSKRLFVMQSEFQVGHLIGRFVDGVWKADLYSNGIEEAQNPTSLLDVKHALIGCVNEVLKGVEYSIGSDLVPVFDEADKMVGTIQHRNGSYEAWSRVRTEGRPGNLSTFVGRFDSPENSTAAIIRNINRS